MATVEARVNERAIEFIIRSFRPDVMREIAGRIDKITREMEAYIKDVTYPQAGLQKRTGALQRSIRAQRPQVTSYNVIGRVVAGQNLPYAAAQEYGATITPVNRQFLAIPIGDALTSAGVARFGPREAEQAGWHTYVQRNIIFGYKDLLKAPPTPLFVLKRSVTLPERPYMRPALKHFEDRILRDTGEAMHKVARRIPQI